MSSSTGVGCASAVRPAATLGERHLTIRRGRDDFGLVCNVPEAGRGLAVAALRAARLVAALYFLGRHLVNRDRLEVADEFAAQQ